MIEIKDTACEGDYVSVDRDGDEVNVRVLDTWVRGDGSVSTGRVKRADFIAAAESELGVRIVPADAVVIERSEYAHLAVTARRDQSGAVVYTHGDGGHTEARMADESAHYAEVLYALARIDYDAAHPPVDQAQVEAVKAYVREFAATNAAYPISHRDTAAADARADTFARWLVERFDVTPKDGAR